MDINGTSRPIEEIHSLQGETIPLVQSGFSELGSDEAVFL